MEELSQEIELQIRAAEVKLGRRSPVDPAKLAKELADIPFKPEYATDLGTTKARLYNWQPEIHQTRNFHRIFAAADRMLKKEPPKDPVDEVIREAIESSGYLKIFGRFKAESPALYQRMEEVVGNLEGQTQLFGSDIPDEEKTIQAASDEEKAEWAYIASSAYGLAADIARSLDRNYPLEYLYIGPQPGKP